MFRSSLKHVVSEPSVGAGDDGYPIPSMSPVAGYARSSSFTYRNRIPAIPGGIRFCIATENPR
jgi:hypothetical protein